jgi:hypothetical protein
MRNLILPPFPSFPSFPPFPPFPSIALPRREAYVSRAHRNSDSSLTPGGMMRLLAILTCAAVLAGCSKPEDRSVGAGTTSDTTTGADTAGAAATLSLSDLAGTWKVRATDERGGNPVETEVRATADTSGWTMTGPNKKLIPVRVVAVAGDSVVTEAGPYESFMLKGVPVRIRTVYRLQGDKLVGTTEATYKIGGRDSVAQRRSEGTRIR